jgi:hypothetical protein
VKTRRFRPSRLIRPRSFSLAALLPLLLLLGTGCAGTAWKQALQEDTPAAYHRFMREHGDSRYADAARERIEFHKVLREPTLSGYERFRRRYPESTLTDRLLPALEEPAFEVARASGTAEAYRGFVRQFPGGPLARRAEGNAVFVERGGFGADPTQLDAFAAEHPESDFAAEARRTVEAVEAHQGTRFTRLGLVIDVDASTPERRRVRQALIDRIERLADQMGVALVVLPEGMSPGRVADFPSARLEIRHVEVSEGHEAAAGTLARPERVGRTHVMLREGAEGAVIADRRFELRVEDKSHVPDTSVLFSAVAPKYWEQFFIPVARWRNDRAVRPPIELGRPVVDVEGVGDRAIVLYEDGDFDLIGLADPTRPVTLARYVRGEDYKKWSGVSVVGDRVALFGEEGLELVRFTPEGPIAERSWPRGEIGRVLSIAPVGHDLVIVGAKGMQVLDPTTGTLRRVMRRVMKGLASAGETLVFADGESVYVSTLALLAENRVVAQMKLGRTFGPENVRVVDGAAIVTGPGGAVVIDLADPRRPRALAKLASLEVGEVEDAARVRGRVFLVGARGLQLLSRGLDRVEETIDVGPSHRLSVMGRHLVAVDEEGVVVVDATPWAAAAMPAAPDAGR